MDHDAGGTKILPQIGFATCSPFPQSELPSHLSILTCVSSRRIGFCFFFYNIRALQASSSEVPAAAFSIQ
jgi:hypothetical protein